MDATKLSELKVFIDQCKSDPSLLSTPSLSFFRDYLESLGAKIPTGAHQENKDTKARSFVVEESDDDMEETEELKPKVEEEEEEDEIIESDVELEGDTVEPDNDPPQKMGDSSVEVTDENREAAQVAKGKAMEALSEGNFDEAIEHLTEAITLNPTSAIMYGNRASVYIKLKKPNAAIRDANAALEINPDSAKGYKSRGMARAMLGEWAEAAKDLHLASTIDYDEEISAVLKKVEPNAHKLEEHRRKYDRLRKEREDKNAERDRLRRRAEAQAAYDKAKKEEQSSSSRPSGGGFPGGMPGGFPGGMPGGFPGGMGGMPGGFPGGMGGMPGGFPGGMPAGMGGGMPAGMGGGMPGMGGGMPAGMGGGMPGMGGGMPGAGGMPGGMDFSKILNDPELMTAFSDPEVMAALQDVMKNPANLAKHQANPKVAPVIAKMMGKFGGGPK
ncbi:PREDICTED: FAM10 family protein At4g22670 [Camelina sativa]|uniref:FAM10 family protein At4g22670 n=1 Tax=Camelina sativa TaxID=90675 RepID=A0ABM0UCW3_CAMSA|nr:PREDICTED: FAM10 family protein At4g22670 [Camelina sativa]